MLCALVQSDESNAVRHCTRPRRTIYMAGDVDGSSNVETPPQRSHPCNGPATFLAPTWSTNPNPTPAMEEL